MIRFRHGLATLVVLGIGGSILADDENPPPWRGANSTWTVQEWEFYTPQVPLAPDGNIWGSSGGGAVNPYGTAALSSVGASSSWTTGWGSRVGTYALVGPQSDLTFDIPNDPGGMGSKLMRVQVTWNPAFTGLGLLDAAVWANGQPHAFIARSDIQMTEGFVHSSIDFMLPTCPSAEQVVLSGSLGPVIVDQVVVDTLCVVPEPATIAGVACGVAVLVRRRRAR